MSFRFRGDILCVKIYDLNRDLIAILENAYGIGYEKSFNEIWTASFSLPLNDPKNEECQPLNFVEIVDDYTGEYIGLFRIIPSLTRKNESDSSVTYQCEHVLATLLDDVLFQYHQTTNLSTKDTLQYILDRQNTSHWKLGTVAFTRYFSYKWENENLLSALFSVPKPFDVPYQWTWDTTSYPWTLNLVAPETVPTCEIRYGKNMVGIEREIDPMEIVNRIYPLGYGEGVNQLTIRSVNNGIPYVEDQQSIQKYGLRSYIWVDKRFEDVHTLKANAEALLKHWKDPKVRYRANAADISSITGEDIDKLKMGRIVRMVDPGLGIIEARIVKESKRDMTGDPANIELEIANKSDDIATLQSDLERRQKINEIYAQGATNIDSYSYNDNADQNHPAVIRFYIPEELVRINKMLLNYEVSKFRAYSKATKGGGEVVATTGSGGGTVATSSSGGGTATTSSSGGEHRHQMFAFVNDVGSSPPTTFKNFVAVADRNGSSVAGVFFPGIGVDLYTNTADGQHSHNVTIPNHTHTVTVPNHTHNITIPNHIHEIEYGIFELPELPSSVVIKVDGNTVPFNATSGDEIDLLPYLSKNGEGKVERGTWHEVTITPNTLGRVNANIFVQFFLQSRGGGDY